MTSLSIQADPRSIEPKETVGNGSVSGCSQHPTPAGCRVDREWWSAAGVRVVRNRWSIENSWHWVRDVTLREDAHRYRETNGVQIVAMLRTMAINSLRLNGIWSVTEGIAALAHDIKGLLMLLGWRKPATEQPSG